MTQRLVHDIIIGDFGRAGFLRYLKYFSIEESRILKLINKKDNIFDEERRVNITTVCNTQFIKRELLPISSDFNNLNTNKILIGNKNGPSLSKIFSPLKYLLLIYIRSVLVFRPLMIRVIIPCNTLTGILEKLHYEIIEEIEKDYTLDDINIQFPNIVEIVFDYINKKEKGNIGLWSTEMAFEEYQKRARVSGNEITFIPVYLKDENNKLDSIKRASLDLNNILHFEKFIGQPVLCGCTDLESDADHDSLRIFVNKLIREVYFND